MTAYDSASFSAGHDAGTRVAACLARLAALELMDHSRWWNRWRCRLMASALVACADDLDASAEDGGRRDAAGVKASPVSGPALVALRS